MKSKSLTLAAAEKKYDRIFSDFRNNAELEGLVLRHVPSKTENEALDEVIHLIEIWQYLCHGYDLEFSHAHFDIPGREGTFFVLFRAELGDKVDLEFLRRIAIAG